MPQQQVEGSCFKQLPEDSSMHRDGLELGSTVPCTQNGHIKEDNADSTCEDNKKPKGQKNKGFLRSISKKQKVILASLAWMHLVSFCAFGILAPFFPSEAEKKGVTQTVIGFVFGCFPFVFTVMSPVWGKTGYAIIIILACSVHPRILPCMSIPFLGIKVALSAGVCVAGTSSILFGFLDRLDNLEIFTTLCFVLRICQALGASAFMTGSFILVTQEFPQNVGAGMGIMETSIGVGLTIGPAIGGYLYEVGGYYLPFVVLGTIMISHIPLYLYILPKKDAAARKSGMSMISLLRKGRVLVILMVIVLTGSQWSFLEPTLELHLNQFHLSESEVGLFFLVGAAAYAVSCVFCGRVSDATDKKWVMMATGLIGSAFSFLFIGPSPLLPFVPSTIWLNGLSVCLLGVFNAFAVIPTFQALIDSSVGTSSKTEDPNLGCMSVVAGIWTSTYSLGEVLGPCAAGLLVDHIGFPASSTAVCLVTILVAIILVTFFTLGHKLSCCRNKSLQSA